MKIAPERLAVLEWLLEQLEGFTAEVDDGDFREHVVCASNRLYDLQHLPAPDYARSALRDTEGEG